MALELVFQTNIIHKWILGVILTASAIVAAGIALYQSEQFQRWMNNSRRKVALTLHNLGDELYPHEFDIQNRQDISMTEDTSEAAEERRRLARDEIFRRRSFLENRQKKTGGEQPMNDFNTLVDKEGKLKSDGDLEELPDSVANSTAVDVSAASQLTQRHSQQNEIPSTDNQMPDVSEKTGTIERDGLHIDVPSDQRSSHASETLDGLTPTSEAPQNAHTTSEHGGPDISQSEYFSTASESHAADHGGSEASNSEVFYAHPDNLTSHPGFQSPFADLNEYSSGAPSTAGSFSHIVKSDASSDGTLSDAGQDGIATPVSWSEVSSVVSDMGH